MKSPIPSALLGKQNKIINTRTRCILLGARKIRTEVCINILLSEECKEQNLPQKIEEVSVTSANLCSLSS